MVAENARLKAEFYAARSGLPALADDSGLEVHALGGEPGVRSARYAGPGASDADRIKLVLEKLDDVPFHARLARFVVARSWDDLSAAAREELKIRVLDSVGCALGAIEGQPVAALRGQLEEFGGRPLCTLIGGGRTAPDRAALYNGALVVVPESVVPSGPPWRLELPSDQLQGG